MEPSQTTNEQQQEEQVVTPWEVS
ncbi:hypothetical protein A2U01_0016812, partial [Trifolium medium]|nr:hypothetical protein [Trifolium medium]